MADPTPKSKSQDVYLVDTRVFVANLVAQLSAAALTIGVLGAVFTWGGHSALFDLASKPGVTVKPDLGYLFGPVLIMIALPIVRRRPPRIAYRRRYRARVAIAALLWIAGGALLAAKVASLDGYEIQTGAYVAAVLLTVGLLATLAMWPAGLRSGRADRRGRVESTRVD